MIAEFKNSTRFFDGQFDIIIPENSGIKSILIQDVDIMKEYQYSFPCISHIDIGNGITIEMSCWKGYFYDGVYMTVVFEDDQKLIYLTPKFIT